MRPAWRDGALRKQRQLGCIHLYCEIVDGPQIADRLGIDNHIEPQGGDGSSAV